MKKKHLKRSTALILSSLIVSSGSAVLSVNAADPEPPAGDSSQNNVLLLGDVNGDGEVTTYDATLVQQHVAESHILTGKYLIAADVNEDGIVNIADSTDIISYVKGIEQKHIGQEIILLGDVNGDYDIAIQDATDIQRHLSGAITIDEKYHIAADINKNGIITDEDYKLLQQYLNSGNTDYKIGKPVWGKMSITDFSASPVAYAGSCSFSFSVENAILKDNKLKSAVIEVRKQGVLLQTIDYLNNDNPSFYCNESYDNYMGKGFFTATAIVEDWAGNTDSTTIEFELQGSYVSDIQIETDTENGIPTVGEEIRFYPVVENVYARYAHYVQRDITIKKDGKLVDVISDTYTANWLFWTPKEAGKYTLTFDITGYSGGHAVKTIEYEVYDKINVSFSLKDGATIPYGVTVPIDYLITGGKAPYTYEIIQNPELSNTDFVIKNVNGQSFELYIGHPGHTAEIDVNIKDSLGTKFTKRLNIKGIGHSIYNIAYSKSNIMEGETININANSAYGYDVPITARFIITNPNGKSITIGTPGRLDTDWTPTVSGTHTIVAELVCGSDSFNGTAFESKQITYTVKKNDLTASIEFDPDTTELPLNYVTTVKAKATGGVAPYQYKFGYKTNINSQATTTIQDYSSKDFINYTAVEESRTLVVYVKDSTGKIATSVCSSSIAGYDPNPFYTTIPTTATVGKSVSLSAQTSNSTRINASYRFRIEGNGTSIVRDAVIAGGPTAIASWTPKAPGEYTITAEAVYRGNVITSKTATCKVSSGKITASCTLDKEAVAVNAPVTITAAKTSKDGISYKYSYIFNGTEKTISNFSDANTAKFTPKRNGKYTIKVTAKDAFGNTADDTHTLTVESIRVTNLKASTDSAKVGDNIIFTAASNAKNVPVTFEYAVSKDGKKQTLVTNKSGSAQWTPDSDGNYVVSASVIFDGTVLNTVTIPYSVEKKIADNTTTIYYNGFSIPYIEYKLANGKWSTPVKMVKLPETAAVPGMTHKYTINLGSETSAEVRFSTAAGKIDDLSGKNYVFGTGLNTYNNGMITSYPSRDAMNSSTFASKPAVSNKTISLGKTVTLSCTASGGSGNYKFVYSYKFADGTKWKTTSTGKFTPEKAGTYIACVTAKDGKITQKKYFIIKVISVVESASTLSADTIKKGESVTVNCIAVKGSGKFEYSVLYKKASSEKWSNAQAYSKNSKVVVTPSSATTYEILVKIKDTVTGRVAKQTLSVNVVK